MLDPYRALAAAILICAIKDVQDNNRYKADALEFLADPAALWLCEMLDIHPDVVTNFLATLRQKAETWRPTGTWLSLDDAALAGGYHPIALGRKLRAGQGPGATKVGDRWLIPRSAIPVIQKLRQRTI